jgi:phosphoribosylamine--glycine ligase
VKVFHAGTILDDKLVVTNGGRVLCVTALGNSVSEAQRLAYEAVDKISWNDAYVRTDIGHRAIARENRVTR